MPRLPLAAVPLLFVASLPAQTQKLDSLMARYEGWGFSGSVLVAKEGKPILAKGYGFADARSKRRNTEKTLFEIASITKQFTAAAILKLESMGKLSVEDPIHKHLPGVPESCREITIHHLLSHTSGVPGRNTKGNGVDLERAVRDFCGGGPKHPLGKHFEYWNGGYSLLAGIVERASGESYMEFSKKHLFEPAGMTDTGFTGDKDLDPERAAIGTSGRGRARSALDHPYRSYGWQYKGMGGAVTTVVDMWKWDRALHGDKVLDAKAREKMFRPVLEDYAYGWRVKPTVHGKACIQHGGGVRGFVSTFRRYPDPKDDGCIVVLANTDTVPVYLIVDNLECLLFGKPLRHKLPPARIELSGEKLAEYAGIYKGKGDSRLVVRVEDGALMVGVEGQSAIGQLLTLMWPGWPADFQRSNARAVKIVKAIAAGDVTPLKKQMARGIPASWPGHVKDKLWPQHEAKYGELKSVRALGCCTRGRRAVVVLALDHEKNEKKESSRVKIEFSKEGLQILDWNGPEFPATLKIRPVGKDSFVDFQWRDVRRLQFERKDGKVTGVGCGKAKFEREG